ncbi:MAG TPA: YceI family protein [Solirubrobacteraceae bacterium]|nr:YceI family protein [Solirubrobacteraceae bacterium]
MSPTQFQPSGIRLGIARGVSYGLFGPPDQFVAPSRDLGAGLVRVYVYWGQVQPEPDRWDWTVVDAFLAQLTRDEEAWVTVCSSSPWATNQPTDFLPSSPAKEQETFHRFVRAMVSRCAGRVRYWQCNNEPSNTPLLWAGSAADYAAQLEVFHRAVREADPSSAVVLGGCGYDVLSSSPVDPPRQFFDRVLATAENWFDLFSIHLYDDPPHIPRHIETVREMMRAHGYERPVVVGEYNGPTLFQLPEVEGVLQDTMAAAFADAGGDFSTGGLARTAGLETPERRAMKALYARRLELPPRLQMLMAGCPLELEERRHRINCREIVSRNLFALSAGVRRTMCWHLAPEIAHYEDPFTMMELLQGKLLLLAHDEDGQVTRHRPAAETFGLLARHLDGATSVARIVREQQPEVFAFTVERHDRGPLVVLWRDADLFSGEDEPPIVVEWPWPYEHAVAVDALGVEHGVALDDGHLTLSVSVTPMFVIASRPAAELPIGRWTVDPAASTAGFSVGHYWGLTTVAGEFTAIAGELEIDERGRASGQLRIDATSVTTGDALKDRYLRTTDWLPADEHREITFIPALVQPVDEEMLAIDGTLAVARHEIPLALTARVDRSDNGLSLSTSVAVDRRSLGMTWGPPGMTSDDLALSVRAHLKQGADR